MLFANLKRQKELHLNLFRKRVPNVFLGQVRNADSNPDHSIWNSESNAPSIRQTCLTLPGC